MSDQDGELTDFPEMDQADVSAATGIVPQADPGDEDPAQTTGAAGGDDDPAADPPPANDPAAELPAYRREAIANRENQELQSRIDRLERLLDKQNTRPPVAALAPAAGEELTPEQKGVQDKFFKLFPQAKSLFEKAEQILKAADVAPGIAAQAEQADNFRAESALKSATDRVAERILGAGKTGVNLRPQARQRVGQAFAQWAGVQYMDADTGQFSPQTPPDVLARASRYSAGDPSLFDEFAKDFLSDFTPVNRAERVADAQRASAKSPRGGPASAPPPASPKPPKHDDEDELHNAAFRSLRADAAAG